MFIGIDLALRNIGIVHLDKEGALNKFALITSDPKKINGEKLLVHNNEYIALNLPFMAGKNDYVALEGLSFNSKSASVDLIAANHWMTRILLTHEKEMNVVVVPPKSWQKSIVTKEILAKWANNWPVIRAKRGTKLTKEEAKANNKSKAEIRKLTKDYLFNSVPEAIRKSFVEYIIKNKLSIDGKYDLADAYHLANHLRIKNG